MMTLTGAPSTTKTSTISMPRLLLHAEGFALFAGAIALYAYQGFNWWVFALLLLAPDLFALGYLLNTRIGAYSYNFAHTTVLPLALAVISFFVGWETGLQVALIWFAHIGMDRTVGYGLKYPSAFKETHLGRV
jgi:Domain of unknown function (DUF4260)